MRQPDGAPAPARPSAPNGAVWWHISSHEFGQGRANSKFPEMPVEWIDGHADYDDVDYDAEQLTGDLQTWCVYQLDESARLELEFRGFAAATNFGLGNSLSMAPEADLWAACERFLSVECYELFDRALCFPWQL